MRPYTEESVFDLEISGPVKFGSIETRLYPPSSVVYSE